MKYNKSAISLFMRITEKLKKDPSFSSAEKINKISDVAKFYKKDLVAFLSRDRTEETVKNAFSFTH